jgi:hypothetical protein
MASICNAAHAVPGRGAAYFGMAEEGIGLNDG